MRLDFDKYFWQVIRFSEKQIQNQQLAPLTSGLYLRSLGYYSAAPKHHCRRSPVINAGQLIIYCLSNSGWVDYAGKFHRVKAGEFFVLPQQEAHAYGSSEENSWEIHWLHFMGDQAERFMQSIGRENWGRPLRAASLKSRNELFQQILDDLENQGETWTLRLQLKLLFPK